ncbi:hypothetical protein CRE_29324 [Caenorhabditis remanei]|uniref:Skp1-related protein n=2 Tax=Caenorhabditis remanei TaxID=31234 RepID=E3MY49_CAERE|nr:hypothetical protein CRE_29324 [Caenorhabditis remanei]
MPVTEIKINFKDSDKPVDLKSGEVIKKCPAIARAIEADNGNWETEDTIVDAPIDIPFPQKSGEFLFSHILKYIKPAEDSWDTKPEDFPEANAMDLDELKSIIELANFLECTDFMHCIGFVIAKKVEVLSIEEIAAYFGVECKPEANFFDEADGWVHPPKEIFEGNN